MANVFRVESIWQLLGASGISAVYIPGENRPAWNAVEDLARNGALVSVWCKGGEEAVFRELSRALPQITVQTFREALLPSCNVLVIDETSGHVETLRALLVAGTRPAVIATSDSSEDELARQEKYALLLRNNYHFAGVRGGCSLWTMMKRLAETGPALLTKLPREVSILPLGGPGVVMLDCAMAPPAEVVPVKVRAALAFSGWALISADAPPAVERFACVRHEDTGVLEYLRLTQLARPDVSAHFRTERLSMTGFDADLSPLCRRRGIHVVTVVQSDGLRRYESETLFRFALESQDYELSAREGLARRYLHGSGIEIGALQRPMPLSEPTEVRYIDRMTVAKLLEHYPEIAQYAVQSPDILDDAQQLEHIAEDSQDFIIANHFLEHCPDPIRSIHTMLKMVKQGGILYLAVPDKRHTIELRRPSTPYSVLRNAYVSGQRSGAAGLYQEWAALFPGTTPEEAKRRAIELMEEDYSIHYNVWANADLLSFLLTAKEDFHIPFELIAAVSSENETIVLLERTAGRLPI